MNNELYEVFTHYLVQEIEQIFDVNPEYYDVSEEDDYGHSHFSIDKNSLVDKAIENMAEEPHESLLELVRGSKGSDDLNTYFDNLYSKLPPSCEAMVNLCLENCEEDREDVLRSSMEYSKDPMKFNGVSQKDFI